MTERYIIDDAGTLIDMQTRETYDYVSDVCPVLNKLSNENEQLKKILNHLKNDDVDDLVDILNSQQMEIWNLKKEVKQLKNKINTYHEGNKTLHKTLQRYWEINK